MIVDTLSTDMTINTYSRDYHPSSALGFVRPRTKAEAEGGR